MAKIFLALISVFSLASTSYSQCFADAGPDTTACVAWYHVNDVTLGATPTVSGGVAPYIFTWEADIVFTVGSTTFNFSASDYLSDTTIANPDLTVFNDNTPEIEFILTVTDALGNICKDSVIVKFTQFSTNLTEYNYLILEGDSLLYTGGVNVFGGTPPLTYLWSPTNGLSDSTLSNLFYIKPNQALNTYSVSVTDADGCHVQGGQYFHVKTGFLKIDSHEDNKAKVKIYPTPAYDIVHYELLNDLKIDNILISDLEGSIVKKVRIDNNQINISDLRTGVYLVTFSNSNGSKVVKHILKK